jgi:hypothetical protein
MFKDTYIVLVMDETKRMNTIFMEHNQNKKPLPVILGTENEGGTAA